MSSVFRRLKKRTLYFIIFCVTISALFFLFIFPSFNTISPFSENCKDIYSDIFMAKLCTNYSNKLAHGNLCSSLCDGKSFIKQGCRKHSNTIVINGKIDEKKVVVKWKKPKWPSVGTIEELKGIINHGSFKDYNQETVWKDIIFGRLQNVLGKTVNQRSAIQKKVILDDLKAPTLTDENMAASFLSLTENDEYAMMGTFQELRHIPKLYGYCGQAYVIEKLTPYSNIFPAIVHKVDWKRTLKLALSFLDMVAGLETAKSGPLKHCDIQEGNFGITDEDEIKLIDTDLVLTKEKADMFLAQPNCSSDSDCDFFDCISMCDLKRGKCLTVPVTSNLQVLCRDIFKSSLPSTGLFGNMPWSTRLLVEPLLNDCSSAKFGYLPFHHERVQTLMRNLKFILSQSLAAS